MSGKVGFLVWNKFQYIQIKNVLENLPNAELIIWLKNDLSLNTFNKFVDCKNSIRHITRRGFSLLDGDYDLIVAQNRIPGKIQFNYTKLGILQYSLAKDITVHNIRWSICDVGFVYGKYTYDSIKLRCPTIQIGNPRFDQYFNNQLDENIVKFITSKLDTSKKTIAYLPTWGDLSSEVEFKEKIDSLHKNYNVIQKVHHLAESDLLLNGEVLNLDKQFKKMVDESLYIYNSADLVLSDYSGSIFDALYLKKPVIQLRKKLIEVEEHEKISKTSIEIEYAHLIGPVIYEPKFLEKEISEHFNDIDKFKKSNLEIVNECFVSSGNCTNIMVQGIKVIIQNKHELSRGQYYAKKAVEEIYFRVAENKTFMTRLKKISDTISKKIKRKFRKPASIFDRFLYSIYQYEKKRNIDFFTKKVILNFGRLISWKQGIVNINIEYYFSKQDYNRVFEIYKNDLRPKRIYPTALTKSLIKLGEFGYLGVELEKWMLIANSKKLSRLSHYENIMGVLNCSNELREEIRRKIIMKIYLSLKSNNLNKFSQLINSGYLYVVKDIIKKYNITSPLIGKRIKYLEEFLGELELPIEIAAKNGLLSKDDKVVLLGSRQSTYGNESNNKLLEIYLPSSFLYKKKQDSSSGVREQMVSYYTNLIRTLSKYKIAYIPILQHGLNVKPINNDNYIFSHHTLGGGENHFHIKISALNGYISFDGDGFAGWATTAKDLPENRAKIETVNKDKADKLWEIVYKEVVEGNQSKYAQPNKTNTNDLKKQKYIFLPLQVTGDLVAQLAYIKGIDVADYLCEKFRNSEYKILIKRHPLCTDEKVVEALDRLSENDHIIISDGSVHELIKDASLVVTVNSGVGMESLLHLKKVLITGGADYFYGVSTAKTVDDLDRFFEQTDWWSVDKSEIKKFLYFYLKDYLINVKDVDLIEKRFLDLGIPQNSSTICSDDYSESSH